MNHITATDAKNRFGQVLEQAQSGPVHVQKNGRDVAVVISPAEYQRLQDAATAPSVNPKVRQLLEDTMNRRKALYQALAK